MAELKFIVSMDSSAFQQGAKDVVAQVKQMSNEVKKEGDSIQKEFDSMGAGLGKSIGKYLAAFGGAAVFKELINNVVRVRSEFQKAGVAIETMLGSKSKADALMQEVKQIAASSPLEFGDITRATQQMLSFNIAAEDAPKYIKAIGDVAMGEKDRFASLSLAFSQMSATGKLMGQDLLQMINAGFNPLAEISRTTGKSIAQLKDEMAKGAISAEMVQQAFISATSAGGKFFGMSENAAKTISGQMSMLSDAINSAFNEIGEKSEGIIGSAIKGTTTLVKNYETIIKALALLAANYGVYRAAVAATVAIEEKEGIVKALLAIKTEILEKKQLALNAAMSVNPYVAAAVALSALVSLLVVAATSESNYEMATRKANEAIAEQEQRLEKRKSDIESLISIIKDETKTTYQQIKAYERLKQLAPELTKEYSREALAKMESAEAQKVLNKNMEEVEYDEAVAEVERLTKAIEAQKKAMNQANPAGSFGNAANAMAEQQRKELEALEASLDRWAAKLAEIQETQKKAADEARPIEIRIKEAKGNEKVRKDILDFWDKAAKKIDELSHPNMVMSFEGSKQKLDAYINEVKGTLDNLQKDMDKHPKDVSLRLKYEEGQKVLAILQAMKESWLASGNTTIPITLQAQLDENLQRIMASYNVAKDTLNKLFHLNETPKTSTTASTAKTAKAAKKNTEDDKLRAKKEQQEYLELVAQQEKDRKRAIKDMENETWQFKIDLEKEGAKKTRMQLDHDYEVEKLQIERAYEDLKQAKIDAAREVFEADPANKKNIFDPSKVNTAYTELETQNYKAAQAAAKAKYERGIAELEATERQAMIEYLREYGNYQQQKLAITEDYAAKIKDAQTEGDRLALMKQQEEELEALNERFGITAEAMADLFGDAADMSVKSIQKIIKKYEQLVKYLEENKGKEDANVLASLGLSKKEIEAVLTGKVSIKELANQIKQLKGNVKEKSAFQGFVNSLNDALKKLGDSRNNASKVGEAITDIGKACSEYLPNVESFASSIANIFGLDDGVVNTTMNVFKGLTSAATGIGQIIEGNYMDGIVQAAQGISTTVGALRDMLYSGRNMEYVYKNVELEAIRDSVDAILQKMDTSSTAESIRLYQEALERYQESMRLSQEALIEAMGKSSSSTSGSHNHRSVNYYMGQFGGAAEIAQINKLLGTNLKSWGDLWLLSPDQLKEIQTELPNVFAIINKGIEKLREKASESSHDEDAEKALQAYLELAGKLEEIESKFTQRITGTTLDTIQSEFASTLSDMTNDAEAFADNFEDMLRNAVINSLMNDIFNDAIEGWYDSFVNAYKDDNKLSKDEAERLRKDWTDITNNAIKQRDDMLEVLGIKGGSSDTEGSGAYKALASFSQEQGDELNGRLTAIQIGQQRSNESLLSAVTTLQNLSVVITANATALSEMRNLMLIGNGHLEDIAKYTKISSQNSELLQTIATKIDTL